LPVTVCCAEPAQVRDAGRASRWVRLSSSPYEVSCRCSRRPCISGRCGQSGIDGEAGHISYRAGNSPGVPVWCRSPGNSVPSTLLSRSPPRGLAPWETPAAENRGYLHGPSRQAELREGYERGVRFSLSTANGRISVREVSDFQL
jgi:hypothetical protein